MTHRPNAITHTQEYTVLPGVVRYTFIIFGLFTTPNLCPPDTKSWRRHCQPDIVRRIGIASTAMHSMNKVWRQTRLQLQTKLRLYQTCILSILLYGSETWTLLQEDLWELEVFHMRSLHMILWIRWHDCQKHRSCRPDQPFLCSEHHHQETKLIVRPCGETR